MDHDERVTVGSPDFRAVEVRGITGTLYRARDGGMYDMHPADAAALVHEGGFTVGVGGSSVAAPGGHVCPKGHRNWIKTCGRCETAEDRAALRAAGLDDLADEGITYPMRYEQLGPWDHVFAGGE